MDRRSLPLGRRMTMQTSPKRSGFRIGSSKSSRMVATTRLGSPSAFASVLISATVARVSFIVERLGALVLSEQVVERLAQQYRFLLLHPLGETFQTAELSRAVVGGLQHHVVRWCEPDSVTTLLLRCVQRQVRASKQLARCLGASPLRVARRVRDADRDGATTARRERLRERSVELLPDLVRPEECGLERNAGGEEREF